MKPSFLLFIMLASRLCFAQIGEQTTNTYVDPFVKAELDALNLKYSVTDGGNFKLSYDIGNSGRSQTVLINSKTYNKDGVEVREIWSISDKYDSKYGIKQEHIFMLLNKNAGYKFGAWQIEGNDEGPFYVIFSVKVAAKTKGEVLKSILSVVASRGDEIEKELNGKDNF